MRHFILIFAICTGVLWGGLADADEAGVSTAILRAHLAHKRGDYAEALAVFRPLAEKGTASAQAGLGIMYWGGDGVPQDDVQAHLWLNLAAAQGDFLAEYFRDKVAESMTPAQIAEAQRLAREWKPKK